MSTPPTPTVDVRAPNGKRIVLRPVVRLDRLPGLSPGATAAVLVLCAIFLATAVYRLNHTDLWGHLNFGRWIAQNGQLPQSDPFRSAATGTGWQAASGTQDTDRQAASGTQPPFLNVPWLGQLLGYGLHQALGLEGLVLGHALLATLSAGVIIMAVRARGVPVGWAVAAAAVGYVLALPVTGTIRPQLFGVLAFAAILGAIARLHASRAPLFWIPAVFALWANLHGSFPMGLAALGCYAMGVTLDSPLSLWERGPWADPRVRRAWLALALATAASCLNPLGVKLLVAVAGFAGNGNLAGISEWRPMTLGSLSGGLFFASLLVTAVLLRWSPRRVGAGEVLLLLLFGVASLVAIRMLVWWALVWPWVVAPHAAAAWLLYRHTTPVSEEDRLAARQAATWRLLLTGVCVFATLWWAPPTYAVLTGRVRAPRSVLSRDTPETLAEQLEKRRITGPIFAPMDWADYLIWRTGGAVEPIVYSHVHLTGENLWRDFLHIRGGAPGWLDVADHHGLEYLVLRRQTNERLLTRSLAHPRCRVLHEDPRAVLVEIVPAAK